MKYYVIGDVGAGGAVSYTVCQSDDWPHGKDVVAWDLSQEEADHLARQGLLAIDAWREVQWDRADALCVDFTQTGVEVRSTGREPRDVDPEYRQKIRKFEDLRWKLAPLPPLVSLDRLLAAAHLTSRLFR